MINLKPKLLNKFLSEGYAPFCYKCFAPLKRCYLLFRTDKCINNECENYYDYKRPKPYMASVLVRPFPPPPPPLSSQNANVTSYVEWTDLPISNERDIDLT